jgi:hypothetical protein
MTRRAERSRHTPRTVRSVILLGTLAATTLLAVGCGGSPQAQSSTGGTARASASKQTQSTTSTPQTTASNATATSCLVPLASAEKILNSALVEGGGKLEGQEAENAGYPVGSPWYSCQLDVSAQGENVAIYDWYPTVRASGVYKSTVGIACGSHPEYESLAIPGTTSANGCNARGKLTSVVAETRNHIVFDFQWGSAKGPGNNVVGGPSPELTAFVDTLAAALNDSHPPRSTDQGTD